MGIFTTSNHSGLGGYTDYSSIIPAMEGYDCTTGAALAAIDVQHNDMALFEAVITSDFNEVAAMNEGVTVINEGVKDIIGKVIEAFKKLLAKIKGIFQAFLAKLGGVFKKNKTLYNDYKKQITSAGGFKDLKIKTRMPKSGMSSPENATASVFDYSTDIVYSINNSAGTDLDMEKLIKSDGYDSEQIKDAIIKARWGGIKGSVDGELNEVEKECMDKIFDSEETKDDWSLSDFTGPWCGMLLDQGDKFEKDIKKNNERLNKAISKIIDSLEKIRSDVSKEYLGKGDEYKEGRSFKYQKVSASINDNGYEVNIEDESNRGKNGVLQANQAYYGKKDDDASYKNKVENYSKKIGALQKIASNEQEVITKYTSTYLSVAKYCIARARKLWTSAAAYVSTHKEGYEFAQAIGETYEYSFYDEMETV